MRHVKVNIKFRRVLLLLLSLMVQGCMHVCGGPLIPGIVQGTPSSALRHLPPPGCALRGPERKHMVLTGAEGWIPASTVPRALSVASHLILIPVLGCS